MKYVLEEITLTTALEDFKLDKQFAFFLEGSNKFFIGLIGFSPESSDWYARPYNGFVRYYLNSPHEEKVKIFLIREDTDNADF